MRDCCSLEETALYWEAGRSPLAIPKGAGGFFCLVAWFFSYFLLEKRAAEDEMVR